MVLYSHEYGSVFRMNSFVSPDCMGIVLLPLFFFTSFASVLEYTCLPICITLPQSSILVGANNRTWIPFGIGASGERVQTGLIDFPDGLVPFRPCLPCDVSISVSFRMSCRFRLRTGTFPFSIRFLFLSCLKLHESPRKQCPFEVQ